MSILAEALTEKDLLMLARIIGAIVLSAGVLWPIFKLYQAIFGKFATLDALRARTDPLEGRIKALELFHIEAERERTKKLMDRIDELEDEREERRRKH